MTAAPVQMRRCFVDSVYDAMKKNEKILVVTGDVGYKMWDTIALEFPKRFFNVGAAEQAMLGVGIGLALEGLVPIVYSITPFLLYRPLESIRNYVNREKIPVKLVGSGRDRDYLVDGFSHWAEEDRALMGIFNNIRSRWPEKNDEIPGLVDEMIATPVPYYVNLKR